jgi:SAM-dependent methyltransferase
MVAENDRELVERKRRPARRTMIRTGSRFLEEKERVRRRLLKFTRRAFRMLPAMVRPRILDIGCGSGVPTLELARLSEGEIIALDIDRAPLDELARKAEAADVSARVKTVKASLVNIPFPAGRFDILWAEGSIAVLGFERGLEEWRRLLRPGGFLAVHDEVGDVAKKLRQISACGYKLLGWFEIGRDVWRREYSEPLENLIARTVLSPGGEPELLEAVRAARREVEWFRKHRDRSSSAFFVMQKAIRP